MSETTELYTGTQPKADEPASEVEIKEVDPHAEMRQAIAEKYERARLAEVAAGREQMGLPPEEPEPVEQPEPEPEPAPVEATPEPEASVETPQAAPQPVAPQPQLFPMPLPDGRVAYVTAEQAAQLARIGAQTVYQPQPAPPVAQPEPPAPQPALDMERARTISQRLQYGTPDEQTQALVELAEAVKPQTPQVDVDAIRRQVLQEVRAQNQLDQNLNTIGSEFPDIFRDRIRTQVAALTLHELRGNPLNNQFSDLDLYREACKQVQSSFAPPQSQPGNQVQPAPQAAPPTRLERKRAAPSIPAGLNTQMPAAPSEPRVETIPEIIAKMRVQRNQPAIN